MSIIDTFDNTTEAIVKPLMLVKPIDDFPEIAIATFKTRIIELIIEKYKPEIVAEMRAGWTIPVYKFMYKGKKLAIYQTVIGGPCSAAEVEEVHVYGAKKFLFFGSCGTLDSQIAAGHFIIPTSAYRDEGTSYHYAPPSDYIEIPTANRMAEIFTELNIPYITGKTWTTDAIYRETRKNMEARKADGCVVVEMECASVMAVGQFHKLDVYQFLYGEDTLDGTDWDSRTMGKVPKSAIERYLQIALEVAIRV